MKAGTLLMLAAALLWPASSARAADATSKMDAKSAFERLKKLSGGWEGHLGSDDGRPVAIRYEVTSAGSVVMERLVIGGTTEMVSMYHLDGNDLVMTHYCAAGNQPRLRLNPDHSSPTELSFDFTGGTNFNPAKDGHMHSGRILFKDDTHFESVWTGHTDGKPSGNKRFILARKGP